MQSTTIRISDDLKNELSSQGSKEDTYEDIIRRNINFTKKFSNEAEFAQWFEENYRLIGFDDLINKSHLFPDYVMKRNGATVRVELETLSSHFVQHGHDPSKVDLVVCLLKTTDLPVQIVEIPSFEYIGLTSNRRAGFEISEEQAERIKKLPRSVNISEEMRGCLDKVLDRIKVPKVK